MGNAISCAVAEHADCWLSYAERRDVQERKLAALADHCRDVGPDLATIRKAVPWTVYLHSDRATARGWAGDATEGDRPAFAGDPMELRDRIHEAIGLGFDMVQLRFAGMTDTADVELFADEVLPHFR